MEKKLKNILQRSFLGEARLWKVFWLIYLPITVVFVLARKVAIEIFLKSGNSDILYFVILLSLVFGVWIIVSIWRCARNVEWKSMFYLARAWVCLYALSVFAAAMSLLQMKR